MGSVGDQDQDHEGAAGQEGEKEAHDRSVASVAGVGGWAARGGSHAPGVTRRVGHHPPAGDEAPGLTGAGTG
jgi:hypothetical protein